MGPTPSRLGAPNSRPHNKTELLGGFHNWRRSSASSAGRISSRLMSPRLFDDHTYGVPVGSLYWGPRIVLLAFSHAN